LATSRQPLGVEGECVHRLPSLAVPGASTAITADDALSHGAVALFVERAKSADSRFSLTDDTAPIVADICHLDGIPFAIELAAARIKVLALPSLSKRLDERFKILTGGSRTALPRQRTLTALIDWSYGLLGRNEQTFFSRLGVFAGGFTFDAAAAVGSGDGVDETEVLDLLSSLADKSLILADTGGENERYRLLESTRAYALEKVEEAQDRERLTRRHAEYFRDFATQTHRIRRSQPAEKWLALHEPEIDNLRSALIWALQQRNDVPLGATIASMVAVLWQAAGLVGEARQWLRLGLEEINSSEHPVLNADLQLALSRITSGQRSYEMAVAAQAVYERTGDAARVGDALQVVAWNLDFAGDNQAGTAAIQRASEIYRRLGGHELSLAVTINIQAIMAANRRELDLARALYRECLERFRALGDERRVGGTLTNLGACEIEADDIEQADRYYAEALTILSNKKNVEDLVIVYGNLVGTRVVLGNLEGARDAGREGLRLAMEMGEERYIAELVLDLGHVAASSGDLPLAARILGYARTKFDSLGVSPKEKTRVSFVLTTKALDDQLEPAEIKRLTAEGAAWSEKRAIEEAMKA
jgi:predicted ATPase